MELPENSNSGPSAAFLRQLTAFRLRHSTRFRGSW